MPRSFYIAALLFLTLFMQGQHVPIHAFNYSTQLTAGYNVLLPDSSNVVWQVGRSTKFDSVLSIKPALYTDTLAAYPPNIDEGVVMILHDISQYGFPYRQYDIDFKHRFDTDSAQDGGYIQISLDSGGTWVNALAYMDAVVCPLYGDYYIDFYGANYLVNGERSAFTGAGRAFRYNHIHLGLFTAIIAQPEMIEYPVAPYLRFGFVADSINNQKPGWQIDDLEIWGVVTWGMDEQVLPITVTPNPSTGLFTVNSMRHRDGNVEITDSKGAYILSTRLEGSTLLLDLRNQPAGFYFLRFNDGTVIKLQKQ